MRNLRWATLVLLLGILITSCKLKKDFYLEGVVINEGNQQPLPDVRVYFKDGLEGQGFIGGTDPENFDSTTTNAQGEFKLGFRSKSNHGFVSLSKDGYVSYTGDGTSLFGVDRGAEINSSLVLMMNGIAYFNPVFNKISEGQKDSDSLRFHMLGNDLTINTQGNLYRGKGPHNFNYEIPVSGDKYFRYALEFNTTTTWKTVIDSVYIPTSPQVFKGDTILY
jgi:hypothetical protein